MGAMTSLWRFATRPFRAGEAPPRENSPARREAEKSLTDELTGSYRPGSRPLAGFFDGSSDLPDFGRMLADVPAMMATARVSHVMDVYKSGISGAEVELQDASSPEVGEFALSEAKRFWQRCLLDAQNSYDYGRGGAECVYTDEDGPLRISHLLPFAGLDARPLLRGNDYLGIRVQGAANVSDLWGAGALPAKGFWHAHNKKYNRWFGFPQPYPAWRAWRRLCCRNGAEEVTDGAIYRFGLAPFIGRFPQKDVPQNAGWGTPGLGDGTQPVSTRDRMRQMMEELIAGAVLCLSSQQSKDGVYDWDVYPLERVLDVSGLTGYCDSLEKQISLGIGVPPEMIEAAEVGSGYSGRAIPLEAWTMRQQTLAWVMLESWWRQIGRPLIWWNYGPGAWARLGVADLLASRMKALAAAARGGQGGDQTQAGTFQGRTGKWFRKNEQGRTVPAGAPGGQQFATRGEKFTGRKTNSLGRVHCYEAGRHVACHSEDYAGGTPDAAHAEASELLRRLADSPHTATPEDVGAATTALMSLTAREAKLLQARYGLKAKGTKKEVAAKIASEAARVVGERERYARQARAAGVDEEQFFGVADEVYSHAMDYQAQLRECLADARESYKSETGKQLNALHKAFRGGDYTDIPGFERIARTVADRYPELLGAHGYETGDNDSTAAAEKLYELLSAGSPAYRRADAYDEALTLLAEGVPF